MNRKIKGYSAAQIIEAERPLLEAGAPLMARASKALAEIVDDEAAELALPVAGPEILVLVGAGNNGGDGLYAAAELATRGYRVGLLPTMVRVHSQGLEAALEAGAFLLSEVGSSESELAEASHASRAAAVVVDAVLGTGSAGRAKLRGAPAVVVDAVKEVWDQRRKEGDPLIVVAADIPSGLDPDTGFAHLPTLLPADVTATFGACKAGLLVKDGPSFAGEVVEVDIGLLPNLRDVTPVVEIDVD